MIPYAEPVYYGNEEKYVADAVKSKWISGGEYVDRFEEALSKRLRQTTIVVSNGTTALELAYLSLLRELPEGRYNIIVPAFGFMAAGNVARNLGITVKFADVDPYTWNIDPLSVEKLVDNNTIAVVAVHNYGHVGDLQKLKSVLKDTGIYIIEDCAEAFFTKYNNKNVGTIGDIATFSFQATKFPTTGEGGAFTTKHESIFDTAKLIRSHGLAQRGTYKHQEFGMNYRMSNIHAAMGLAQLEKQEEILINKYRVNFIYWKLLNGQKDITLQGSDSNSNPCSWSTALKLGESFPEREHLVGLMREAGIEIRPGFISPNYLPTFLYVDEYVDTPVSDELSNTVISLPCSTSLSYGEIEYICNNLKEFRN